MKNKTLLGLFNTQFEGLDVIRDLEKANFEQSDISFVTPTDHIDTEPGSKKEAEAENFNTPFLSSLEQRDLSGIGRVSIGGPILSELDGTGSGLDNFVDALTDFGAPESDAHVFAESLRRGSTLVGLYLDDNRLDDAVSIFQRHGAIDIDKRADLYRKSGFEKFNESAPIWSRDERLAERERFSPGVEKAIPVVEEKAKVSKRKVDLGRVRVITRVIERPVEETVNLRDERVEVERRPVDRPVSTEDLQTFKEGEIEFSESREEAVLEKEARVKEEVVVSKDVDEHQETVRGTTRSTDVKVERREPGQRT